MTHLMPKFLKISAILGVAFLSLHASPAVAAGGDIKFNQQVLNTEAGTEKVYKQLLQRVKRVCGSYTTQRIHDRKVAKICNERLMHRLVDEINHPRLTDYHNTKVKT